MERAHPTPVDGARLEERLAELGSHAVVMERLHGTVDHAEVLAGIQDCVINVIGSEELAVFEVSPGGRELRVTQAFGVSDRRLDPQRVGEGPIGRAATGEGWVVGDGAPPAEWPDLTACVPLRACDAVVGVLAIWRMLAHKPRLGAADRVVLDLIARHGGIALHLTRGATP